jgi:hypothetical protein
MKIMYSLSRPKLKLRMHYLLADPLIVGAVTWIGFAATFLGIGIAVWQISLVTSATRAATEAINGLSATVHSRERLLDLSSSLRQLDSARHHIGRRDYSTAAIFLEFARNECVQVQELLGQNSHKRDVNNIVVRLTKLIEALTLDEGNGEQDITAVQRGLQAREITDAIGTALARLRYRYTEDGK